MKALKYVLSGFFFLSFFLLSTLNAQPPAGPMDPCAPPPEPPKEKPYIPGLTDDQAAQLDKIHEEERANMEKIRLELCEKETELRQLRSEESSDESKMLNLIEEIGKLRTETAKNHLQTENKLRKVLTKQQWQAFQKNRPKPPHPPKRPSKKGNE